MVPQNTQIFNPCECLFYVVKTWCYLNQMPRGDFVRGRLTTGQLVFTWGVKSKLRYLALIVSQARPTKTRKWFRIRLEIENKKGSQKFSFLTTQTQLEEETKRGLIYKYFHSSLFLPTALFRGESMNWVKSRVRDKAGWDCDIINQRNNRLVFPVRPTTPPWSGY